MAAETCSYTLIHLKYRFMITSCLESQICHFMAFGNGNNLCNFSCDEIIIKSSLSEKILGLSIENNLDFSDHIFNTCKTENQKLNALLMMFRDEVYPVITLFCIFCRCLSNARTSNSFPFFW